MLDLHAQLLCEHGAFTCKEGKHCKVSRFTHRGAILSRLLPFRLGAAALSCRVVLITPRRACLCADKTTALTTGPATYKLFIQGT